MHFTFLSCFVPPSTLMLSNVTLQILDHNIDLSYYLRPGMSKKKQILYTTKRSTMILDWNLMFLFFYLKQEFLVGRGTDFTQVMVVKHCSPNFLYIADRYKSGIPQRFHSARHIIHQSQLQYCSIFFNSSWGKALNTNHLLIWSPQLHQESNIK